MSRPRARTLWIGGAFLLALLVPLLLDLLIVTDEERIRRLVDRWVEAVEARQAEPVLGSLSEEFRAAPNVLRLTEREQWEERVPELLARVEEARVVVDELEVTVTGDAAEVLLESFLGLRLKQGAWPLTVSLRLEMAREEGGVWRVRSLRELHARTGVL